MDDLAQAQPQRFNVLTEARYGTVLYNKNDMYIGRSFDLYGEFSEGEVEVFRQLVQPGMVVLDIGANIGAHTLFFAQAVRSSGTVHAFEPQRIVFQTLAANVALNSLTNVHCHQVILGETPGSMMVPPLDYGKENNFGGLGLGTFEVGEAVQVMSLDDLDVEQCDFIKLDVEGMELQVLRGARETLRRLRPLLYVENDRADRQDALIQELDAAGYTMYWHRPPLFNPANVKGNPVNIFGDIVSVNMVCVPSSLGIEVDGFERVAVPPLADAP
jgi:FkbM family methyltransferase